MSALFFPHIHGLNKTFVHKTLKTDLTWRALIRLTGTDNLLINIENTDSLNNTALWTPDPVRPGGLCRIESDQYLDG